MHVRVRDLPPGPGRPAGRATRRARRALGDDRRAPRLHRHVREPLRAVRDPRRRLAPGLRGQRRARRAGRRDAARHARDAGRRPARRAPGHLMPSRFCLPDELGHEAWQRFGDLAPGWERVQAIVDAVHADLEWVAGASNPWTTAVDAHRAGQGVCRDFAHLAITFCRALNIPARYVFGYIPEIDVPPPVEPMDFAAWFEVYLDGAWHTFDARNNRRRVGRVVVGRGRDAVDVALITSFGPVTLTEFEVRAA